VLTFTADGWGTGGGGGSGMTPKVPFVIAETRAASRTASGVPLAQEYLNDHQIAALPVRTVNMFDILPADVSSTLGARGGAGYVHNAPAAQAEVGRRIAAGIAGRCDYHTPTC